MHLHSDFSVDADDTMEAMCEKAVELGLKGICFTEHMDMNPRDPAYDYFNLNSYLEAVKNIEAQYKDKLMVLGGVEYNRPQLYAETLKEVRKSEVDVILGSIHWMDQMMFGSGDIVKKYSPGNIFTRYYDIMKTMVSEGEFDVLSHLDYPKRYIKEKVESHNYKDVIKEILEILIKKDIALEINTASLRKDFEESMPGPKILRLYQDLGGKKVTLGSDAHRVSEIAANFEYGLQLVDKYNFTYGYFKDRKFVQLN